MSNICVKEYVTAALLAVCPLLHVAEVVVGTAATARANANAMMSFLDTILRQGYQVYNAQQPLGFL